MLCIGTDKADRLNRPVEGRKISRDKACKGLQKINMGKVPDTGRI